WRPVLYQVELRAFGGRSPRFEALGRPSIAPAAEAPEVPLHRPPDGPRDGPPDEPNDPLGDGPWRRRISPRQIRESASNGPYAPQDTERGPQTSEASIWTRAKRRPRQRSSPASSSVGSSPVASSVRTRPARRPPKMRRGR